MIQRTRIARRSSGTVASIAAMTIVALGLSLDDGAARAQTSTPIGNGRVVSLEYEFTVAGLRAFRAEGILRLDGERYVVDSKFNKEGLVAALSSTFNGSNRAWGLAHRQGLRPLGGWSWIQFRDNTRTWQVGYRGDGSYREEHKPPFSPRDDRTVTPAQKHDAFDPLTAAVSGALGGGNPCDRVYPIFDSKRRFDVALSTIGVEPLADGEIRGVGGQALVCQAVMKRIAGYDAKRMKQDAYEKRAPKLWFVTLNGFDRPVPVKMEMATSFGTVLGKLTSYNVRPMTAADRIAMDQ